VKAAIDTIIGAQYLSDESRKPSHYDSPAYQGGNFYSICNQNNRIVSVYSSCYRRLSAATWRRWKHVEKEVTIVAPELKSLFSWIRSLVVPDATGNASHSLDFDPAWHGDHWQNLLSSPMDARHYVMEDWATPKAYPFEEAEPVAVAEVARA
jgi:hypothetical protein